MYLFLMSVRLCGVSHDDGVVNSLWAGMPFEGKPWMIQGPQSWTRAQEEIRKLSLSCCQVDQNCKSITRQQ